MLFIVISLLELLLGALLTGAMFGVWLSFNPSGMSFTGYVLQQQQGIRTLDPTLPILGAVTILLTLISAALSWADHARFAVLLAGAFSYMAAGLITRLANQRINSVVVTWTADAPPANWGHLSKRWWYWHRMRTAAGILGLCLLITAATKPAFAGIQPRYVSPCVPQTQPAPSEPGDSHTESRSDSMRHLNRA